MLLSLKEYIDLHFVMTQPKSLKMQVLELFYFLEHKPNNQLKTDTEREERKNRPFEKPNKQYLNNLYRVDMGDPF